MRAILLPVLALFAAACAFGDSGRGESMTEAASVTREAAQGSGLDIGLEAVLLAVAWGIRELVPVVIRWLRRDSESPS